MTDKKTLEMIGRFIDYSWSGKGKSKRSEKYFIHVPPEMLHDERFPLKLNEPVMLRVEGQKLVIMKMAPVE